MRTEKTFDYSNIYAILPAHNEETSIKKCIDEIKIHMPGINIWVIDNASSDKTAKIALSAGAIVHHEPQKGKGYAVRRAISLLPSTAKAVYLSDADDTYSCIRVPEAIDLIRFYGFDMVIGNRVINPEQREARKPAYKRGHSLGNLIISIQTRLLHQNQIDDSLSGWRVFSLPFLKSFPGGASGFEIEAELNAHAYLLNSPITNLDVFYRGRAENSYSKLNTYVDGLKIIRMNFELFRNNRPQLAFTLLGVPWLVASCFLVPRSILGYLRTGMVLNFPSLIAGVGTFIIASLLSVSGALLQRIKTMRANHARYVYNGWVK